MPRVWEGKTPEIVLDGIGKTFAAHAQAVEDLSITIPDGSFTTFSGPFGCGNTTILRMTAGVDSLTSGVPGQLFIKFVMFHSMKLHANCPSAYAIWSSAPPCVDIF